MHEEAATAEPERPKVGRRAAVLARVMPFVSLGTATVSAIWMSRSQGRARVVAIGALVGWLLIGLAVVYMRRAGSAPTRRQKVLRYSTFMASQAAVQQALAFPLPFFIASLASVHVIFATLYVAVAVACFWDPLFVRLLARPNVLAWVHGFAAFVSLVVVLPMLGLANVPSFIVAGVVAALGVPMAAWLRGRREWWRWPVAALVVGVVLLFAPLVPPAPLALGRTTFATSVTARAPGGAANVFTGPAQLYCWTAIRAPLGLSDRLFHVWQRDGREVMRVELDVRGGPGGGYQTWSVYRAPKAGIWRCSVETALGQRLGDLYARVASAEPR